MAPDITGPAPTVQRATAREFLAVVFRRRWIILGLFLVVTATVLAVALTTPVVYVSTGRLLVLRGERQSSMIPDRHLMNDWETELGSDVETAKSWPVVRRAQELLRAEPDGRALKIVGGQVDAEVMGKSNVLAIAYQDGDPEVAQRVCDALIRSYIEFRQRSQLSYPSQFFTAEIQQADSALRTWTEQRRRYADQTGVVDLEEQKRNLIYTQADLQKRLSESQADLASAQTEQRIMRQLQRDPAVDLPTLGQPYSNESALQEIKRRVVEQQGKVAELRERYRDDSPPVLGAEVTLDTLRSMLRREVDARLEISQSRIAVLHSRTALVGRDLSAVDAELRQMPDREARLYEMDQQIASWRARYDELVKGSDQARITENTTSPVSVTVLSPAGPAKARNTRDYVRLALAPGFSLVVGIGVAFFLDGLDLTVHTAGQAEAEVELPVLAAITERKKNAWRHGTRTQEKTSA